ncbi:uncharacterized protein LOC130740603 [Lotus japonicus]|uniref:Protein preY, mitochondrial n=1 Tax=Lotus japonicus TaxID=34305 RepID=I3SXY0_LOTJA|nr:uncharacterized protein LOC130740603 [Lotus japonicus]AFK45122.1 unknown [Lotus japonicus]
MVRVSNQLLQNARTLVSDFLVCPLSKQPLRYCEESNSLISDAIGVSFPVKNGVPCLIPKDGTILEDEDESKPDNDTNLSAVSEDNQGRSS